MKKAFVLLSIVLILLFVSIDRPSGRATAYDSGILPPANQIWEKYTVKDEEFSARLPTLPAMTTKSVIEEGSGKEFKERVIGAYSEGVGYAIHTFENQTLNPSLDDLIRRFNLGSIPPGSVRELKVGAFRGREYVLQTNDIRTVSQYFVAERHSYVFRAIGSKLGNLEKGMMTFFSSLTLKRKPDGKEVVDGPGEQPDPNLTNNDDVAPLTGKEVSSKAVVVTQPEPSYTAEARQYQITGTVVLRGVFSSSGTLTKIRVVSGLPHGLIEKAIEAARRLKFIPAIKDGRFVSMWIQLEYNFNLY
jgi:TonB family protein